MVDLVSVKYLYRMTDYKQFSRFWGGWYLQVLHNYMLSYFYHTWLTWSKLNSISVCQGQTKLVWILMALSWNRFNTDKNEVQIWFLILFPPGIYFTNLLWAAFAPISLRQKHTNLKCKYRKAARKTFVWKSCSKDFCMKKLLVECWLNFLQVWAEF